MSDTYAIRIKAYILFEKQSCSRIQKKKPSTVAPGVVISGPRDPLSYCGHSEIA